MRRRMLAVLAVGLLVGAEAPKGRGRDADQGLKELQGAWSAMIGRDGKGRKFHVRPQEARKYTLTIQGDKADWTDLPGLLKAGKGTVSVEAGHEPPRIVLKAGKQTFKGIYRPTGSGLILCLTAGDDYPKDFGVPKGGKVFRIDCVKK